MWKRIWTIFVARNKEFYRDRASFSWNLLFPVLVIVGFALVFSNDNKAEYKVGFVKPQKEITAYGAAADAFLNTRFVEFVEMPSIDEAQKKLTHHRIDMLVDFDAHRYWMSE